MVLAYRAVKIEFDELLAGGRVFDHLIKRLELLFLGCLGGLACLYCEVVVAAAKQT